DLRISEKLSSEGAVVSYALTEAMAVLKSCGTTSPPTSHLSINERHIRYGFARSPASVGLASIILRKPFARGVRPHRFKCSASSVDGEAMGDVVCAEASGPNNQLHNRRLRDMSLRNTTPAAAVRSTSKAVALTRF